jgi:hypothetical protein
MELINRRNQLEKEINAIIAEGTDIWMRVAKRLDEIRERGLWKPDFKTYKDYVLATWGKEDSWARHLIADYKTVTAVTLDFPVKQGVARALTSVPEELRQGVIDHIKSAHKPVNSGTINGAVREISAVPVAKATKASVVRDATDYPIPLDLVALWVRRAEVAALIDQLDHIRKLLTEAEESKDKLWIGCGFGQAIPQLKLAAQYISAAIPHAICPNCQGRNVTSCPTCHKKGFINKFQFSKTPQETLKIRAAFIQQAHEKTQGLSSARK